MGRFYHVESGRKRLAARLFAFALACLFVVPFVLGLHALAFAQHGAPAAAPSASASASSGAARASTEVKVRDKTVFVFRAEHSGRSAAERAKIANGSIEALLAHPEQLGETHFEETQGTAVVFVGKTPVITLAQEDVDASGEASLAVLAAQVTTRVGDGVSNERKRSAIATSVFSFSLVVFSGLIAFLVLQRAGDIASRLRTSVTENPEKVPAIRLGNIEFLSAGALRGAVTIALTLGYRFLQVAIAYGWLVFALSLFEATKGYTERLTGMVVTPLYGLAARIGGALPLVIVAAIALITLFVVVRFVGLFFDSVTRGDTRIAWVPRELARPTSALVRFAIIVVSLVMASPIITGESDGVMSRTGIVALIAVALAATPVLASAAVGITVVFGGRVKKGEQIEVGGRAGRVVDVGLLGYRLEDATLSEVNVPHLMGLWHVTRIHRHAPLATIDVVVDPAVSQDEVEKALFEAARSLSGRGHVELVYLDGSGAHWRVTSAAMRHDVSLGKVVQDALKRIGAGLGTKGHGITVPVGPVAIHEKVTRETKDWEEGVSVVPKTIKGSGPT